LNNGITNKDAILILEDKYSSVEDFIASCKICDSDISEDQANLIYPYLIKE
jgi:hypothetical protein